MTKAQQKMLLELQYRGYPDPESIIPAGDRKDHDEYERGNTGDSYPRSEYSLPATTVKLVDNDIFLWAHPECGNTLYILIEINNKEIWIEQQITQELALELLEYRE